jgi:hypothetical protein
MDPYEQLERRAAMYRAFDTATAKVSAYAISEGPRAVGRVVFTGRGTCWLQVWGTDMVKARVGGGGYDMHTAAVEMAARKLAWPEAGCDPFAAHHLDRLRVVMHVKDSGENWARRLEDAGYTVQGIC